MAVIVQVMVMHMMVIGQMVIHMVVMYRAAVMVHHTRRVEVGIIILVADRRRWGSYIHPTHRSGKLLLFRLQKLDSLISCLLEPKNLCVERF